MACTGCDPADDIVIQSIVTKARSSLQKLHLSQMCSSQAAALPEDEALQSINSLTGVKVRFRIRHAFAKLPRLI